jgi:hypothetical protein
LDLDEIRELPSVVERIAAGGPSKTSAPHCWFCGKLTAWFLCDCPDARNAQAQKRPRPYAKVLKSGQRVIVLDPEVRDREHNRRRPRYVPPANKSATVDSGPATIGQNVDSSVDSDTVDSPLGREDGTVDSVDSESTRRAKRAEYERLRRVRLAGNQEP